MAKKAAPPRCQPFRPFQLFLKEMKLSPTAGSAKWRALTDEEKQPYRDRAQQEDQDMLKKLTGSGVAGAFAAPCDGVVTLAKGSSAQKSMEVKVLTEVLLDDTVELVPVFCHDCAKVFELFTPPHTACPHCKQSVQRVEKTECGAWLVKTQLIAEGIEKCALGFDDAKMKKRLTVSSFWRDSIIKKGMISEAMALTCQDIAASNTGRFRFSEDAKRCMATALQDYLEVHLHKVSLVTEHRGAAAPASKDFRLVRLLDDPDALSRSLYGAQCAEAQEPRRKRLRRMSPEAVATFDFEEGQDVAESPAPQDVD